MDRKDEGQAHSACCTLLHQVQEANWCGQGEWSKALEEKLDATFPFTAQLAGPRLGWHQVKDAKNMKRGRVAARVW